MESRTFGLLDRVLGEIDKALKVLTAPAHAARTITAEQQDVSLSESDRRESSRLMRVNHSGEVAAQALYRGQALTARRPEVAEAMLASAGEEVDHLAWCELRLRELKGRTSMLNPLWYAGSFAIGAVAGALGDRTSLGFVAETERQVEKHLQTHMERLGGADPRSSAILAQMTHDEHEHGARATSLGGQELPLPVVAAMRLTSRLMTRSSYWV